MAKKDKGYFDEQILRLANAITYISQALDLLKDEVFDLKNKLKQLTRQHEDKGE